ncbi:hypothetical protein IU469_35640 [Nocardia puris]|nr:hypothetical protein [Nocardia puris]
MLLTPALCRASVVSDSASNTAPTRRGFPTTIKTAESTPSINPMGAEVSAPG